MRRVTRVELPRVMRRMVRFPMHDREQRPGRPKQKGQTAASQSGEDTEAHHASIAREDRASQLRGRVLARCAQGFHVPFATAGTNFSIALPGNATVRPLSAL